VHEFSSFWTLTYDEENYPADASLNPRDTQLFLKRLRYQMGPLRPFRYYLVGEYGDQTQRAHYHAALFGVASLEEEAVASAWGLGFCHSGELTPESAQYLAGYVTKKMTAHDDSRLSGRFPEFARMSRNPGIGAPAMPTVAGSLSTKHGAKSVAACGDVPLALKHGVRNLPLGRYLRSKLREELGFDTVGGQEKPKVLRALEVQALCHAEGSTTRYLEKKVSAEKQKILQIETKAKIWSKKGVL